MSRRPRLAKRWLDELVEEAIIDAYGESEQRTGLLSMIQMNLTCPFATEVLGTRVRVERVDLNDADEIVAVCRRGRERQTIPILELPLPSPCHAGGSGSKRIATGREVVDKRWRAGVVV